MSISRAKGLKGLNLILQKLQGKISKNAVKLKLRNFIISVIYRPVSKTYNPKQ